jgi:hypothetical protein
MKNHLLTKAKQLCSASNGRALVVNTIFDYENPRNNNIEKRQIITVAIMLYTTTAINPTSYIDYLLQNEVITLNGVDYEVVLQNYQEFFVDNNYTSKFKIQYEVI